MSYTPGNGGRIQVFNQSGLTTVVTITRKSGASITVYTDVARTASVSMPDTITGNKTYYMDTDDVYKISCQSNGIECATSNAGQGIVTHDLRSDLTASVTVDRETAEMAITQNGLTVSAANAAYAPLPNGVRNALTGLWHADGFGVKCDGTTDDATALNAAMAAAEAAGGGVVYIPPISAANPLVGSTLVFQPKVRLRIGACVNLARKSGFNGNMGVNKSLTAVATSTDGAITAAGTVLTTSLASQAVVGQTVVIGTQMASPANGAGLGGSLLVANITAVGTGNVTLSRAAGTNTTVAAVALYNRDTDIGIDFEVGAKITGGSNSSTGILNHHFRFNHVDGLHFTGITRVDTTAGKYAWAIGDCTDIDAQHVTGNVSSSNMQFNGNCYKIKIDRAGGTSADDTIAFTASNGPTFSAYNDVEGPIVDIQLGDLWASSATTVLKFTANASFGTYIDTVRCRSVINQNPTNLFAVVAANDTGNGDFRSFTFDEIHGSATFEAGVYTGGFTVGRYISTPITNSTTGMVFTGATVDVLNINELRLVTTHTAVDTLAAVSGTTIGEVNLSNIYFNPGSGSGTYPFRIDGTSSVTNLRISKAHLFPNAAGLFACNTSGGVLTQMFIDDCVLDSGVSWIGDFATTTLVHLNGIQTATGFFLRASGNVTVRGSGHVTGVGSITAGGILTILTPDVAPSASAGAVPTIIPKGGLGTGGIASTLVGSDKTGTVTLTTGTTPVINQVCQLTYTQNIGVPRTILLTPSNPAAVSAGLYVSAKTAVGFTVSCVVAPTGNMTFDYLIGSE